MSLTDKQKYQLLLELTQKIRDTLDLDTTINHILDMIRTVIAYDAAGIFVLNQDLVHGRQEQPRALIAGIVRRGFDDIPADDDLMLKEGKGIIGHVISTAESLIIPDVLLDPHYIAGRRASRSEIAVPIIRDNRAIGALNLESDQSGAYGEDDLEVLQFFADASAFAIEKAMLHRQLLEKELVDKQLEIARETQSRLFPDKPPQIDGFDIAGTCIPAEEIGGDYYDFISLPQDRLGVAVADVSGHGISAALLMTAFRGLLRTNVSQFEEPVKVAQSVNSLIPEFNGDSGFVTAVYSVLDPGQDDFSCVCCGQQPPLLLKADLETNYLPLNGPAFGIIDNAQYTSMKQSLQPGDILVIFTDGVVELTNLEQTEFGVERLASVIRDQRGLSAQALIEAVIRATKQFSGVNCYEDDFTLVIIKRK